MEQVLTLSSADVCTEVAVIKSWRQLYRDFFFLHISHSVASQHSCSEEKYSNILEHSCQPSRNTSGHSFRIKLSQLIGCWQELQQIKTAPPLFIPNGCYRLLMYDVIRIVCTACCNCCIKYLIRVGYEASSA